MKISGQWSERNRRQITDHYLTKVPQEVPGCHAWRIGPMIK
jgi:hypothetical protein